MSVFKRLLPLLLLTFFVIVPTVAIGVAGMVLLQRERGRWEVEAEIAARRGLVQISDELRESLNQLRSELHRALAELPSGDPKAALHLMTAEHPLVRNAFWVQADGLRMLPPEDVHIDPETQRFVQRYAALFDGRVAWTAAEDDPEPLLPPTQLRLQSVQKSFRGAESRDLQSVEASPLHWRPWRWEDEDMILAYLRRSNGDIVGVEVEMSAVYARVDVLLRLLAPSGEILVLLDRADRALVVTRDPPDFGPLLEEIGPLLPFARLGVYRLHSFVPLSGDEVYWFAAGLGVLFLVSIAGAGIGLTAWLNRSRRLALQKTTFVSNVSHEFKTPLTTLRLYSELLLEGRIQDEGKRERYLCTIRDESERLARLVHNVLDFSRLELKQKPAVREDLDCAHLLHQVIDGMRERLDAAGMEVGVPREEIRIYADPDAVNRIFINLIDNAIKYAASGKKLEIVAERKGKRLLLRFQDEGPGIPRRFRKRIFHPFVQVDERITRKQGGTGLGLHLARRLARDNGGDLVLLDTSSGACFQFSISLELS